MYREEQEHSGDKKDMEKGKSKIKPKRLLALAGQLEMNELYIFSNEFPTKHFAFSK